MASKQKKGLLLFEFNIGCGNVQTKHIHVWIWTLSQLYLYSMLPREPDFPRVTIFIVDFIFFYVTIYSLFPLWMVTLLHLTPKQ